MLSQQRKCSAVDALHLAAVAPPEATAAAMSDACTDVTDARRAVLALAAVPGPAAMPDARAACVSSRALGAPADACG